MLDDAEPETVFCSRNSCYTEALLTTAVTPDTIEQATEEPDSSAHELPPNDGDVHLHVGYESCDDTRRLPNEESGLEAEQPDADQFLRSSSVQPLPVNEAPRANGSNSFLKVENANGARPDMYDGRVDDHTQHSSESCHTVHGIGQGIYEHTSLPLATAKPRHPAMEHTALRVRCGTRMRTKTPRFVEEAGRQLSRKIGDRKHSSRQPTAAEHHLVPMPQTSER